MMAANGPILIEIVFVIVGALGFGLWQLVSVNREIARDKDKSADRARHPVGEHRLDDR